MTHPRTIWEDDTGKNATLGDASFGILIANWDYVCWLEKRFQELEKENKELIRKKVNSLDMQLCPKCSGRGTLFKWKNGAVQFGVECDLCQGLMVIPKHIIREEEK